MWAICIVVFRASIDQAQRATSVVMARWANNNHRQMDASDCAWNCQQLGQGVEQMKRKQHDEGFRYQ